MENERLCTFGVLICTFCQGQGKIENFHVVTFIRGFV
jgi:hypothetical protein